MNAPSKMTRIVEGIRYDVSKATLVADDNFWDGSNHDRNGHNTFLYRTQNGRYFTVNLTMWSGERDTLTPVSPAYARELYESALSEHHVSYEEAFPDARIEEA